MRIFLISLIIIANAGLASAQNKKPKCQESSLSEQNWVQIGENVVYFDYTLCPGEMKDTDPSVRIWITITGDGYAVEKWSQRDGADLVSVFNGRKKAYTVYRDLNAVPFKVFKAKNRSNVPAEMATRPFLVVGTTLAPLENLTPDSVTRVLKVFENADLLIRKAEARKALVNDALPIVAIVDLLDKRLEIQK